ncbi:MAG: dihydrofolate reductase [Opitutales bacterium]
MDASDQEPVVPDPDQLEKLVPPTDQPERYQAIAAMSVNRIIGDDGAIPWHLPSDFRWFKEQTMGGVLVMGRKTYESIGRPLPGRETVVLSRSATGSDLPGVTIVREPEQVDAFETDKPIWIAGGSEVYRQFLPRCHRLFLTVVKRKVRGDASFPDFQTLFHRPETLYEDDEQIRYRFDRKMGASHA